MSSCESRTGRPNDLLTGADPPTTAGTAASGAVRMQPPHVTGGQGEQFRDLRHRQPLGLERGHAPGDPLIGGRHRVPLRFLARR